MQPLERQSAVPSNIGVKFERIQMNEFLDNVLSSPVGRFVTCILFATLVGTVFGWITSALTGTPFNPMIMLYAAFGGLLGIILHRMMK